MSGEVFFSEPENVKVSYKSRFTFYFWRMVSTENELCTPTHTVFIENNRFRRIITFFVGMILHVIWWDLFVARIPLLGFRARQTRAARHRKWAGRFRLLAVEMGGVMIKLGQFLSARVDVLPKEITDELKGLQDEVPAVPWEQIHAILRTDLGSLDVRFSHIEKEPIAAASLGQAHRAWLLPED